MKTNEGPVNCRLIKVARCDDARGSLCFAQGCRDIPFDIQRVFWIFGVPEGQTRGGHAHQTCQEVIFAVSGGFEIFVDDGVHHQTFVIDRPDQGILIPAGVWCTLSHFKPGTVCCVMASGVYDAGGYVNDYALFLKQKQCG